MVLENMRGLKISKKQFLFYFYILLFFGCFILVRYFDHPVPTITIPTYRKSLDLSSTNNKTILPLKITKQKRTHTSKTAEFPLICSPKKTNQTCPTNNYPTSMDDDEEQDQGRTQEGVGVGHDLTILPVETCPDYFKWIHQDLKPWKAKGITKEMVEEGKKVAFFRIIILDGRIYVEKYKRAYQTRDVYTIWGILQLLRLYPGKLPDLDLMFNCDDKPVIKKSYYDDETAVNSTTTTADPVPLFHYCGDDEHFDIPFPDWTFWGWHEVNIKPWELQLDEIKKSNEKLKWEDRVPNAYWKGNLQMGNRIDLNKCNSSKWNAEIYEQHWGSEDRHGFNQSNIADQCNYRYKIYMEGKAWSTSEKYIQACDSMLLMVQPRYYEFYSRGLLPLKHYWPINPSKLCQSIKFAVKWGNKNPKQAQEIAKSGSKFIMEELKMPYIYDYMFHLLNEYGKLLKYKPIVPQGAVEVCAETMPCNAFGKEKEWKFNSLVKTPSQTSPCKIPPAYDPHRLQKFLSTKEEILRDVEGLARIG